MAPRSVADSASELVSPTNPTNAGDLSGADTDTLLLRAMPPSTPSTPAHPSRASHTVRHRATSGSGWSGTAPTKLFPSSLACTSNTQAPVPTWPAYKHGPSICPAPTLTRPVSSLTGTPPSHITRTHKTRGRRHRSVVREIARLRRARFEAWATACIQSMARDAALVGAIRAAVADMERVVAERGVPVRWQ
ncbi:hypothetical protein CcaverHIS002_0411290 [Cutaneotrichosporon cavernicola]|uniref:Uncharacterized protein n=1 Tax=Cutaneotrichosporon cavernicola TaxID=279322 RepID=A0AA48L5G7_9TREE|nr:uncharacterized protein CcaverHIS019_0411200 [Cutaneotrichosporon cavernicola]BEI84525.1 hypothetical protein CcaverHIS002_0411290 [Cutaneotrichosporon cavernicola]BEI92300.1 hypothetical protein CcaverHIS019_0411200 [Cutaneotrichosporon cavernicola]BEJ00071.1 hypothetical protein CcaverHIS631_0411130 [Cutaneotrichosporon cavernicola]BEJ07844.1 hypothetical protein CcaverHIS641_0411130 [Cutaneotrichosporon cavernicola]